MAHLAHSISRGFALNGLTLSDMRTRLAVWRSRRALAELDAHALEDIGISAHDAQREAELGPWDVPVTWREVK